MRRLVVLLTMLVPVSAASGQDALATVDPGMTKAQVIERLGAPAAERSRGAYTYLFYQNGCERTCGMSDLVTLEADTVVDAIFRAPHRRYAGTSSSPTPGYRPDAGRGGAPLNVPARRQAEPARATMADEFAALLGAPAEPASPSGAAAPARETPAQPATVRPASRGAAPASVSSEIAELLGDPSLAVEIVPPAAPEKAAAAATQAPQAGKPAPAASQVLSPEVAALLGNPVPAADAGAASAPAPAKPALSSDVMDLLGVSSAPAEPTPAAAAPAKGAEPVQALPRADTIKASGRGDAAKGTWPPPREQGARDAQPARTEAAPPKAEPAAGDKGVWPPPKEPAASRPPAEQKPAVKPDTTKAKDQPKRTSRPTWPPPAE